MTVNQWNAYIIRQDTLLIERHACFDLSAVADNRLADHHVAGNMNIIPDVGMVQVYIITCCNKNRKNVITAVMTHLYADMTHTSGYSCSPIVQLLPMTLLEM